MKGYRKYFLKKLGWFVVTFVFAFLLNFILPRLMPGDPVAAIMSRAAQGMTNRPGSSGLSAIRRAVRHNKPMPEQFALYVRNAAQWQFWLLVQPISPNGYADIIKSSILWTMALQFPAIIVGWIIGNTLGALAAYLKGGFDKVLMPVSIFLSNIPPFGMAIILLVIFGVNAKWFPTSGGYGFDLIPSFTWKFVWSVIVHYQLPFWSIVLIASVAGRSVCAPWRSMS